MNVREKYIEDLIEVLKKKKLPSTVLRSELMKYNINNKQLGGPLTHYEVSNIVERAAVDAEKIKKEKQLSQVEKEKKYLKGYAKGEYLERIFRPYYEKRLTSSQIRIDLKGTDIYDLVPEKEIEAYIKFNSWDYFKFDEREGAMKQLVIYGRKFAPRNGTRDDVKDDISHFMRREVHKLRLSDAEWDKIVNEVMSKPTKVAKDRLSKLKLTSKDTTFLSGTNVKVLKVAGGKNLSIFGTNWDLYTSVSVVYNPKTRAWFLSDQPHGEFPVEAFERARGDELGDVDLARGLWNIETNTVTLYDWTTRPEMIDYYAERLKVTKANARSLLNDPVNAAKSNPFFVDGKAVTIKKGPIS